MNIILSNFLFEKKTEALINILVLKREMIQKRSDVNVFWIF